MSYRSIMAAQAGIEPTITASKAVVLPLHHCAIIAWPLLSSSDAVFISPTAWGIERGRKEKEVYLLSVMLLAASF